MHHYEMVDGPWLLEHIRTNHGPLGEFYPEQTHLMEGDTPSFLGLINNGLGWSVRSDFGGWGGRYKEYQPHGETRKFWTETRDSRDTVTSDQNGRSETSVYATRWRWREHFQNDFAALNGDKTKHVIELTAKVGEEVKLSAEGTSDPDSQAVETR